MAKNKNSISQADSYEKMGEFWDTHDFSEYDVVFEVRDTIRIEASLLAKIERMAAAKGVGTETLINLWLQEKVLVTP